MDIRPTIVVIETSKNDIQQSARTNKNTSQRAPISMKSTGCGEGPSCAFGAFQVSSFFHSFILGQAKRLRRLLKAFSEENGYKVKG